MGSNTPDAISTAFNSSLAYKSLSLAKIISSALYFLILGILLFTAEIWAPNYVNTQPPGLALITSSLIWGFIIYRIIGSPLICYSGIMASLGGIKFYGNHEKTALKDLFFQARRYILPSFAIYWFSCFIIGIILLILFMTFRLSGIAIFILLPLIIMIGPPIIGFIIIFQIAAQSSLVNENEGFLGSLENAWSMIMKQFVNYIPNLAIVFLVKTAILNVASLLIFPLSIVVGIFPRVISIILLLAPYIIVHGFSETFSQLAVNLVYLKYKTVRGAK